jgi:hypothetical protein
MLKNLGPAMLAAGFLLINPKSHQLIAESIVAAGTRLNTWIPHPWILMIAPIAFALLLLAWPVVPKTTIRRLL